MEIKLPRRRRIETLFQRIENSTSSLVSTRSPRPLLCELCQRLSLSFQELRSGNYVYHGKPGQITSSAEAGCPLCDLLSQYFDLGPISLPIRLYGIRRRLSLQEKASLVEEGDIEALKVLNGYDRDFENPFSHKLALYTTDDDVAASSIKRRPFIKDFASEECFRLIKSWLDTCVFHHPGCNSPIISQLPTRVIDVGVRGGQQDPLLFTPPLGYKDSYIALSYCWGSAETKFVLTKEKSQVPKLKFPLATLPKTLKDAVQITQRLGFRFLWVDALCIIQEGDGGEDFRRESRTMRHVYGNATLTIAAAAANTVHEGILRKPTYEPQPECKISYDLPDGTIGTAYVEFEENDKGGSRVNEPLNTRAWTFQERILSPRVVVFYKDQLSWDCTSTLIDSNGPLNPLVKQNQDSPGRYSDYIGTQVPIDDTGISERAKYMSYWRTLIEFYSRRALTNTTDKLKAIAGLAQLIKSKTNDSYIAGLWLSDIEAQLCWYTDDPSPKRPDLYRAPSWSWASIDGEVKFWKDEMFRLRPPEQQLAADDEIDIQFRPEKDEFGDVLEARLRAKGHLHPWDRRFVQKPRWAGPDPVLKDSPKRGVYFDDLSDEEDFYCKTTNTEYFFFYPVFPQFAHLTQAACAIILKRTGSTYRRVGIITAHREVFYSNPSQQWVRKWNENLPTTIIIE